jgi:HAE1 family hydrophobic/amphiphilic exporter-1
MDLIRLAIRQPVTTIVGIILTVLFGIVALFAIPVQLSPNVEEPEISVRTNWPGASPYEVERDIVEEQEKSLKGIPGLYEMESTSSNNTGEIGLKFRIGTDIDDALLRVSNKLNEVRQYPENSDRPVINASGAQSSPAIWISLRAAEDNPNDVWTYRTFFENDVRQFIDRVDGVSDLLISGGVETEMHVVLKPERLASYGLTIPDVIATLQRGNANVSAGGLDVGRREIRIRAVAEYRSVEDINNVVIISDGVREVRLGDIAEVRFGYERYNTPAITSLGTLQGPSINVGIRPEPNANILDLTDEIERVVNTLNEGLLKERGLYMQIVSEQRPYIRGAIELLQQNIAVGGTLAIIVLLLFLRSIGPTIVVSLSIPISIIGTFFVMYAAGSTLNVVSLAGIAFAVGMLVDNAIVVLENIDRHRSLGKSPFQAAYHGTREVWGAVLASSLTTVAVFLPIVFLEDEAGQLFKDIAIAVSSSVMISMIVSITVIPAFSYQIFRLSEWRRKGKPKKPGVLGEKIGAFFISGFMMIVRGALHDPITRIVVIVAMTGGAFFTAWALLPKMEYLPQGNRDLIINVLVPPPGLSFEERNAIGEQLFDAFAPYTAEAHEGLPKIKRIFFVGRDQNLILGVVSDDQARTAELIPLCQRIVNSIPGVFGISNQSSIFQSGLGQGRTITVDMSGNNIDTLVAAGGALMGTIKKGIEEVQVRPRPSLDLLFPEVNFVPDRERLNSVGMTAQEFGIALDVLMDGRDIGDFKEEGKKKIDLIVKASEQDLSTPEQINQALLVTRAGGSVPISSLATMVKTTGLTEVRHLERDRTISLQVTPPYSVTLQETMERIEQEFVPALRESGAIPAEVLVGMSGTADKLTETRQALQMNFVVAAAICYLLMAAMLGNFIYPIIIMFTVPLASAGGLVGLRLVNNYIALQQLDILTMLGFIILVGVVVNNAILIVYQALQNVWYEGMEHKEAVLNSVQTRLRPIYMSACTSVFGMTPLVLWPGPGSELYRGLGAVVLGGLTISTVLTVFLIPALLLFVIQWEKPRLREED